MRSSGFGARSSFLAAIVLAMAGAAYGQEKDGLASIEARFEPAKVGGGAVFSIKGTAKKLPPQTRLIIKLLVKGWKDAINTWEVTVDAGGFQATNGLEGREAAPLVYRAELWLMVAKQVPPVKRALQRDLGVSDEHNEVLDAIDIPVGTEQDRTKFADENVKTFDEIVTKANAEYDLIEPWIEAPPQDLDKKRGELNARLRKLQELYNVRSRKYLTLGEASALGLCRTIVGNAIQGLAAIGKATDQARSFVDEGRKCIERLRAELSARMPAGGADTLRSPPKDEAPKDKKDEEKR